MLFYGKYARGKVPLKQSQVKLQKTKEVTYLEDNKPETSFRLTYLKAERKKRELRLTFWRRKASMKGKCYALIGYKQRNTMCLEYLECKLQEDSYAWCISNLKIALSTKEQRKVCVFSVWKCRNKLQKQVNIPHKAKSKVRMSFLGLKK